MIVELSDLGGDLTDLPPLEAVPGVKDDPVLLLELPQLRVDVESSPKVCLKKRLYTHFTELTIPQKIKAAGFFVMKIVFLFCYILSIVKCFP